MEMEMEMEMELPIEIVSNILSRLPFDSVMQFKCLSKYWYNLVQRLIHTSGELYFAQNHRSKLMENYTFLPDSSSFSFSFDSSESDDDEYISSVPDSVLLMLDQSTVSTLDVDDTNHEHHLLLHYAEYDEDKKGRFNCKAVKKLNCPLPLDITNNINSNFWTMSTSSNGLVCSLVVHNSSSYLFCIFNPFLGEYVTLPDDGQHMTSSCTMAFGFGHIPSTNGYKVVRIVYPNTPAGGCGHVGNIDVYTLGGGGKWRSKGNIKRGLQCDSPGVLVKGSLHWLTEKEENADQEKIILFNLLEEEFDHMIEPPVFYHPNFKIKEWGGCLCGFNYIDELRMHNTWEFYMLRPHSKNEVIVDGEWDKICATKWEGPDEGEDGIQSYYEHLFFYNKATQALVWTSYISIENKNLYKYNTSVVAVEMGGLRSGEPLYIGKYLKAAKLFHGIFHIKSFVSLKALGENNTKRIIDDDRKRKLDNNNKDESCTHAPPKRKFLKSS